MKRGLWQETVAVRHGRPMLHAMLSTPTSVTRELADLPGPRGIPIVGNMLQLTLDRVHLDVEQWARRYGSMFQFRMRKRHVLVVADHELLLQVLKDRPESFRRTHRTRDVGTEMGLKPGVFNAEGQAWRDQRRMVMASLSPAHVRAYFPALLQVTRRLQARWRLAARSGHAIALQQDLMRYTVDGVAGLAFGTDVNTLESDDDVIQRHLDKVFPALFRRIFAPFPYWRLLRLPADRTLERSVAEINRAIAGFIAQARERLQARPELREQPSNLLEAMIVAADQGDSAVDDEDVAGNVTTMLLAGEDTTANTIAWMVYLLHRHPHALERAVDEVRRLAPDIEAFTPEQMASLVYLDACACETMRLKPVAPFLAVEAVHDTRIADVNVPAGTVIWCVLRHDSVDERLFPNARQFEPERWLDTSHASTAKRVAMPFGAGPRVCPGRYLAMLEIKMAMAMLLARFTIDNVGTPDGRDAKERMAFSMAPVGLSLQLRETLTRTPHG